MAGFCKRKVVACFVFGAVLASTLTSILFLKIITKGKNHGGGILSSGDKYQANVFTAPLIGDDKSIIAKMETNTNLNIFNASNESKEVLDSVSKHKCIPYKTSSGDTLICLHPREIDVYVSGSFLQSGQFEGHLIALTANILTTHPGMPLLDLGCNIGTFTVYFAKIGVRVVGVDAGKNNLLLLSRSLSLGKLHQNVTLILNAMSDTHEFVTLKVKDGKNNGNRYVIPSKENAKGVVKTILLDELAFMFKGQRIFIKIDIEGSEMEALNGGKQFFKTVDVRYVLMEFVFHQKKKSGPQICNFFTERGYRPYRNLERSSVLNTTEYQTWPLDVLWIKE